MQSFQNTLPTSSIRRFGKPLHMNLDDEIEESMQIKLVSILGLLSQVFKPYNRKSFNVIKYVYNSKTGLQRDIYIYIFILSYYHPVYKL